MNIFSTGANVNKAVHNHHFVSIL